MTRRAPRPALLLAALLAGCGGNADQLLETAEFEELQRNPTHARQLYEQIVRDYPGSAEAEKAAERLRALGSDG